MLHHQADLSAPPPPPAGLAADVEALLGGGAQVRGYTVLTRRVAVVARVALAGGPAPTAIVKHVPAEAYGAARRATWRRETLEEIAAYRFFARPEVAFARRPGLLGAHPAGALVLEDLGAAPEPVVGLDEVTPALAGALAELHAATRGHRAAYDEERRRAGLDPRAADGRYDGATAARRRRAVGGELVGRWAQALDVIGAEAFETLLAEVVEAVDHDGPWHACIHDDIANHRQCRTHDGRLMVLDFENARWAHALLDVAKVLVGKFERDLVHGDMVHMCPGFDRSLAVAHRRALVAAGGPDAGDEAWSAALGDAVIATAVTQIGALAELEGRTTVRDGLLANLAGVLARVDAVLGPLGGRAPLREVLREVGARATLGRALAGTAVAR